MQTEEPVFAPHAAPRLHLPEIHHLGPPLPPFPPLSSVGGTGAVAAVAAALPPLFPSVTLLSLSLVAITQAPFVKRTDLTRAALTFQTP